MMSAGPGKAQRCREKRNEPLKEGEGDIRISTRCQGEACDRAGLSCL